MTFFRQEDQSGLPVPSSGDLPDPGVEPADPALGEDSSPFTPSDIQSPCAGEESYLLKPLCILVYWLLCMTLEPRKGHAE